MTRFEELQETVRYVQDTEHRYLAHGDRRDPVTLPFMPYQPAAFTGILLDCIPVLQGPNFLDIGCGPGTKMLLAESLFGLTANGIEIDPEMAILASYAHADIYLGDALAHGNLYSDADLIWLYRPFRDPVKEDELERLVMHRMKPGAVLAGGQWQMEKPPRGWITVVDDWEDGVKSGAWIKPA